MEDVVPEAESLLHPINISGDEVTTERQNPEAAKHEGGDRAGGFINHLISNLVIGGDADEEKQEEQAEKETIPEEKGGRILDHIISSPKAGNIAQRKVEAFDVRSENESGFRSEEEVGGGGGGGGLINNIVSNLFHHSEGEVRGSTDENKKEEVVKVGEESKAEKTEESGGGGGLINNIVSNLFHHSESEVRESPDENKKEEMGKVGEETKAEKTEGGGGGGGGIIESIVSHLPTSLPDDAAPTSDEATILIHIAQD
ncbi:uncharacterized protein LOC110420146 [Herrania umbratica]|uniref:Uncharacterized protein LOC110420146 n=1 Tax=Herrania umbratica TaxID=108875 RepID=A0A6J1AQB3_9ROSI|nr:uncharacterized protein LOC110420146 [Herrania umbratica]